MNISCRQAALIGQNAGYPKYSSAAHCLANNPEKSGVMRVPELAAIFGDAPKKRKSDKRRKGHRLCVRFEDVPFEALNEHRKRLGITSWQTYLETVLLEVVKRGLL